jgi:hypothetical protein
VEADAARRSEAWHPGPSGALRTLGGFLRLIEIDASQAGEHGDAFERMRAGALEAVILHGVYPSQLLEATVGRLERHDPPFLRSGFPEAFRSWFYGVNLNLSPLDPGSYFDQAALFNRQLEALLPPGQAPGARLASLLAALDRGRPFVAAPGPQPGQRYMFTTLRAHEEGGFIPPHFDNEQNFRPSYRHLRTLVEPHIVSFVLAFTRADAGGALEVFDLCCEPEDARFLNVDGVADRPDPKALDSVSFRLPPGSMIVLDSGRYLHRLTPVRGSRKRWTACSFMALSRAREAMYCWG